MKRTGLSRESGLRGVEPLTSSMRPRRRTLPRSESVDLPRIELGIHPCEGCGMPFTYRPLGTDHGGGGVCQLSSGPQTFYFYFTSTTHLRFDKQGRPPYHLFCSILGPAYFSFQETTSPMAILLLNTLGRYEKHLSL